MNVWSLFLKHVHIFFKLLITSLHVYPNHTSDEKPGVTTASHTAPKAAKIAIRDSSLALILIISPLLTVDTCC